MQSAVMLTLERSRRARTAGPSLQPGVWTHSEEQSLSEGRAGLWDIKTVSWAEGPRGGRQQRGGTLRHNKGTVELRCRSPEAG